MKMLIPDRQQLQVIEDFIFVEPTYPYLDRNTTTPVDYLLMLGAPHIELIQRAAETYLSGKALHLIACGKYGINSNRVLIEKLPNEYQHHYDSEAEMISTILQELGVPQQAITCEDESRNIQENIRNGLDVIDELAGCSIEELNIGVCCQAFCGRRAALTFAALTGGKNCILFPADTQGIMRGKWNDDEYKHMRIFGEVERCGKYFM